MSAPIQTPILAPIVDTHIHLFQVTREGGVPWPPPENRTLYRDALPARYRAEAEPLGVVAGGIVEASPLAEDTRWILGQIADHPFFAFYVAQLPFDAPDFDEQLAALAAEPRVVGVRGFLWNPALTLAERQLANLRSLAREGMTLDLISRGSFNTKDKVLALADAVPSLRIIVDHLAGARGGALDPAWVEEMRLLARRPNVHIKLSAIFDMWNPTGDQTQPWTAPKDVRSYAPQFDVVLEAFGPERVLFGSDWPVCTMAGTLAEEIQIVDGYLAAHGAPVREQVMNENARRFYRRASRSD